MKLLLLVYLISSYSSREMMTPKQLYLSRYGSSPVQIKWHVSEIRTTKDERPSTFKRHKVCCQVQAAVGRWRNA